MFEGRARGAEAHPDMGHGVKGALFGLPFEGDDKKIPALLAAGLDDQPGQIPAARKDAEFRRHLSFWAGRWRARNRR